MGEPKTISFSSPPFEPAVHFSGPGGEASAATLNGDASGTDRQTVTYTKTETAGFYKALLEQPSHKTEVRNFAVNVDANGRRFARAVRSRPGVRLTPVNYKFEYASNFQYETRRNRRAAIWATCSC